jgi:hypothetical protein
MMNMSVAVLISLLCCGSIHAQHDWQKPKPLVPKAQLETTPFSPPSSLRQGFYRQADPANACFRSLP